MLKGRFCDFWIETNLDFFARNSLKRFLRHFTKLNNYNVVYFQNEILILRQVFEPVSKSNWYKRESFYD